MNEIVNEPPSHVWQTVLIYFLWPNFESLINAVLGIEVFRLDARLFATEPIFRL